jgi:hypothetical protein
MIFLLDANSSYLVGIVGSLPRSMNDATPLLEPQADPPSHAMAGLTRLLRLIDAEPLEVQKTARTKRVHIAD